jgi:hypothetical protein
VLRTESFDTLYSGGGQIWIQSCRASCPLPMDQSHQGRLAGELPKSLSTKNPGLDLEAILDQPPREVILHC